MAQVRRIIGDMKLSDLEDLAWAREMAATGEARRIRQATRSTLQDVATTCGVTHTTVIRWESGQRVPRGLPALRYARVLRMLASAAKEVA